MHPLHRQTKPKSRRRGQSFVEVAIFLPILLILLSGLVEFGFMLNEYLNLLDGPREAARLAVDFSPRTNLNHDDPIFYESVGLEAITAVNPITLNAATDDVVISVFGLTGNTVTNRYPTEGGVSSVNGQWSLQYWCANYLETTTEVGALLAPKCAGFTGSFHTSRFSNAGVENLVSGMDTVNMGVVLVEVFYSYHMALALPWITVFVPNPMPVSSYTIMPLPAAEPH